MTDFPALAAQLPTGLINRVLNGEFILNPEGSVLGADASACFVNFTRLSQAASITTSQLTTPESGQTRAIRLTQSNATAQRMGICQTVSALDCQDLRTAFITLTYRARFSADASSMFAILEWNGSANTSPADPINDWSSASYTSGQFFKSSFNVLNFGYLRASATAWASAPYIPFQVGASANNIVVVMWTENTVAQNTTLDFGLLQIIRGNEPLAFEYRSNELTQALAFAGSSIDDLNVRTFINVKNPIYAGGAKGNGTTDDYAAFVAAFSAGDDIYLPGDSTYRIGSDLTAAKGKRFYFGKGATSAALVSMDTTKTWTIHGIIADAPYSRIFGGLGSVVGLRYNNVLWFGAVGDSNGTTGTDDGPAINKAFVSVLASSASDGGEQVVDFVGRDYQINTGIICYPQFILSLRIKGSGTGFQVGRLYSTVSGPCLWLKPTSASAPTNITDFAITNLEIANASTGTYGLRIGDATDGFTIDALKHSLLENVSIEGFTTDIEVVNTRQIDFRRCRFGNGATAVASRIQASGNGAFTGDLDFYSCEFTVSQSVGARNVEFAISGNSDSGIAGVRYHGCIFYHGASSIYGHPTVGNLGDIWFGAYCQFDGQGGYAFDFNAGGTAVIEAVLIEHCYLNLFDQQGCRFSKSAGGATLRNIEVSNNRVRNIWNALVFAEGVSRISAVENLIWEEGFTSGSGPTLAALYFKDCTQINCNFNQAADSTADGISHVVYFDGASDFYSAVGNSGPAQTSAVSDASVSPVTANKWIDKNWITP